MFEAAGALVTAILELTFFGDGLTAVLGLTGIFILLVLVWAWTQYFVTEAAQDFREWRLRREAMKDKGD